MLTVTVATAGLVAWIWSERTDNDEDEYRSEKESDLLPGSTQDGEHQAGNVPGPTSEGLRTGEEESFISRVSGSVRPQEFFDHAGRQINAGIAAAGVAVGNAFGSGREENGRPYFESSRARHGAPERDENGFSDHERWSEEAVSRTKEGKAATKSSRRGAPKKTVAIVVNATTSHDLMDEEEIDYHTEHAVSLFLNAHSAAAY